MLVFTSPTLNHNLDHFNLTWTTESFSPILAYKIKFKISKVKKDLMQKKMTFSLSVYKEFNIFFPKLFYQADIVLT